MAKHIYMSNTPGQRGEMYYDPTTKRIIDPGFVMPDNTRMHYRGVAGIGDDPEEFKTIMARRGYFVAILDEKMPAAKEHQDERRGNRPLGPVWVFARDLQ